MVLRNVVWCWVVSCVTAAQNATFYGTRLATDVIEDLKTAYTLAHDVPLAYKWVSDDELLSHITAGSPVVLDSLHYVQTPNTSLIFELFGYPLVLVNEDQLGELFFSQQVLVDIFTGNITRWNDLAITTLNPNNTLPDEQITLVIPDSSLTDYFFLGLSVFAQQNINRSVVDALDGVVRVDIDDVCRRVNVEPFALGISWMGEALASGTPMVQLQNFEGLYADPATGVASAMTEFRSLQNEALLAGEDPWAIHPFNMPGRLSWPLVSIVNLVLPEKMEDCKVLNEIQEFVAWVLFEDATQPLIRLLGWEPATTLDVLANPLGIGAVVNPATSIQEELDGILCIGVDEVPLPHEIGASNLFWPLVSKLLAGYSSVNDAFSLTSSSTNITTLLARMEEGEASEADIDLSMTWQSVIEAFSAELYAVPVLMGCLTPLVNLGNLSVTLSIPLLVGIFAGDITSWTDTRIRAINPGIDLPEEKIALLAAPIGAIDGVTAVFASLLRDSNSSFSWSDVNASISESELNHHVKFTNFSISYSFGHQVSLDDAVLLPRMIGKAGHVTDLSHLASCWKGDDDPDCWPMRLPLAFALRHPGGRVSCKHQQLAVQFADWTLDNGVELEPFLIPNPGIDPPFGEADMCNGRSLLKTEIEPQVLSTAAITLVQVLCSIGIIWTIFHCIVLLVARNVGELKSASVFFSLLAVGGVFMMLLGPLLMVTNEPTDAKCALSEWVIVLGFSLTYGSLFAKLYRLYKIFTTRSFVVPRLGNRRLLIIILVFLAFDIILLIIESATDLLGVDTFDAKIPSTDDLVTGYRHLQWRFCNFEVHDIPINILLAVKFLLVFLGAYMAFAVRQVDRRFAASAALGWCFYNMFLTIIVLGLATTIFNDESSPPTNLYIVAFGCIWVYFVTLIALTLDSNILVALNVVSKTLVQLFHSSRLSTSQERRNSNKDPKNPAAGETPEENSSKRSNTSTIFVVNREMFPSKYDDFDAELLEKILEELNYQRTAVRRVLVNVKGTSMTASRPDVLQMASVDVGDEKSRKNSLQIAITRLEAPPTPTGGSHIGDSPNLDKRSISPQVSHLSPLD